MLLVSEFRESPDSAIPLTQGFVSFSLIYHLQDLKSETIALFIIFF